MQLTSNLKALEILSESEINRIIETAIRILEDTGFIIENDNILKLLENNGARTDRDLKKVFIPGTMTESFLGNVNRKTWKDTTPCYTAETEIYNGYFLDPEDNRYKTWTHDLLLRYIRLANKLPGMNGRFPVWPA